jgi:hypothetical protein
MIMAVDLGTRRVRLGGNYHKTRWTKVDAAEMLDVVVVVQDDELLDSAAEYVSRKGT